jgi:PAS domain S-box-containing protein
MPDGNLLGIIRDVSDRNQALERLRTAEERTRFALQNANVGIWDMDYTTGVLRWSEIIEAHYGLAPGTFGGTFEAFVARIHPDDREAMLEKVAKTMKAGTDFVVEHRTIWPDGTVRWLTGAGRTLLSAHGEPVRSVGISQDITERKDAETELARLNTEIQRQRLRVFKATMRTVQDIVNNLLNGLQLVHAEAEDEMPVALQTLVDELIQEAAMKLKLLGNLDAVKEKEMSIGLGIEYPGDAY